MRRRSDFAGEMNCALPSQMPYLVRKRLCGRVAGMNEAAGAADATRGQTEEG